MVLISSVYPSSHNKQFVPQLSERPWMSFLWAPLTPPCSPVFLSRHVGATFPTMPPKHVVRPHSLTGDAVSWDLTPASLPGCSGTFLGEHLLWRVMGGRWTLLRLCGHTPCAGDCTGSSHLRPRAQHGANSFCSKGRAHGFIVHVNLKELCNLLKWAFLFSRMWTVKQSTIQNRRGDLKYVYCTSDA